MSISTYQLLKNYSFSIGRNIWNDCNTRRVDYLYRTVLNRRGSQHITCINYRPLIRLSSTAYAQEILCQPQKVKNKNKSCLSLNPCQCHPIIFQWHPIKLLNDGSTFCHCKCVRQNNIQPLTYLQRHDMEPLTHISKFIYIFMSTVFD